MTKGYLYRHIREDNNTIFYIGIGGFNKTEKENSFGRAFNNRNRSKDWKKIISVSNYKVEIVLEGLSLEETLKKEKEFISLYGRIDLGTGTLINKTAGGQGSFGRISSAETRKKISDGYKNMNPELKRKKIFNLKNKSDEIKKKYSKLFKGKPRSEEIKRKISENWHKPGRMPVNKKKVLCIETNIIYLSISDAEKSLNINRGCISSVCNNKSKTAGRMHFKFVD